MLLEPFRLSPLRSEADMAQRMQSFGQDGEIGNPLVRIRFIIVMIRWTGLAPLEFEFRSEKKRGVQVEHAHIPSRFPLQTPYGGGLTGGRNKH